QDLARADTGQLNRWELEITGQTGALVALEDTPGVNVPDNDPAGIERTLNSTVSGKVREVDVSVDITHTFIGDLVVTLVAPSGKSVTLHNRSGGSADNLIKTYTPATSSQLGTLRGETAQGAWKLKVSDHEAADVGKLNRWAMKIVKEP
ncbi:MAG: proprotein convertase P-domain-containing protein, partial [Nitrospiraceae bacterium]